MLRALSNLENVPDTEGTRWFGRVPLPTGYKGVHKKDKYPEVPIRFFFLLPQASDQTPGGRISRLMSWFAFIVIARTTLAGS